MTALRAPPNIEIPGRAQRRQSYVAHQALDVIRTRRKALRPVQAPARQPKITADSADDADSSIKPAETRGLEPTPMPQQPKTTTDRTNVTDGGHRSPIRAIRGSMPEQMATQLMLIAQRTLAMTSTEGIGTAVK